MIISILRILLAMVFLYAGIAKLWDLGSLAESIEQYQLVPAAWVHLIALTLPPFEILAGLALLFGGWKKEAAFSISVLCGLFTLALLATMMRGISVECQCFGAGSEVGMGVALIRDILLLAVAIIVYRKQKHRTAVAAGGLL